MEQTIRKTEALAQLLDGSERPIYAVCANRQVVYCNAALARWIGLEPDRILGRSVEYHSDPTAGPALTDLCPPPAALAGEPMTGTIGSVGRNGRLSHRRADFVPLGGDGGVLVVLTAAEMSPQELSAALSEEPIADDLHRAIRKFRREQAAEHALETLLGESASMRRVRAQIAAAAASGANVLVHGGPGTGREHIARAIHYYNADSAGKLVPTDCAIANEELLRRAMESLRANRDPKRRGTLLLLNLEHLAVQFQRQLIPILADATLCARVVATLSGESELVDRQLLGSLSTITIDVPRLSDRLEDLPLLAQYFLERANEGNAKQLGSVRTDALDELALYRWPGGLDELRAVIFAAHAAASSHEITPADLPVVIHHAAKAAAISHREPEKIVLDEFLGEIEREAILRAMTQARGNKSAAAELLGMTRPRLYRRLVQLGLLKDSAEGETR